MSQNYEGIHLAACTGVTVAGGAVAHDNATSCPQHPEVAAYHRGRRAGWAEAIAALRDQPAYRGWWHARPTPRDIAPLGGQYYRDTAADYLADRAEQNYAFVHPEPTP